MPSTSTTTRATMRPIDVISRSMQNLCVFLSCCRPCLELLGNRTSITLPNSLSDAATQIRLNATHFLVNYAIIITACDATFLICLPIALIVISLVFFLWLILHFFRVDPLLWGRHVSNLAVILGSVPITVSAIWITGTLNSLAAGIGVGILVSVHIGGCF